MDLLSGQCANGHHSLLARWYERSLLAIGVCIASAIPAMAQDWPQKTVRIINPYAAGTTTDTVARIIAERLHRKLSSSQVIALVGASLAPVHAASGGGTSC
jgi:hypothetical protein